MGKRVALWAALAALAALLCIPAAGATAPRPDGELAAGAGVFAMAEATGATTAALRVYYFRPRGWTPAGGRVVIALHGVQRDAARYRDDWRLYAERYNLLVVCPEFTDRKYPGARYYGTGNVVAGKGENGIVQAREEWVFPAVGRVFAEVRRRTGAKADTFALFGHSAGGQFAHRYAFFAADEEADCIVAANAGWYMMPARDTPFPYGIGSAPLTDADMARAFARRLVVLLGERDTDTAAKHLHHDRWADGQGESRFARGQAFFAAAEAKAGALGVPFNWRLVTVPGVGHDDAGMAAAAAGIIAGD